MSVPMHPVTSSNISYIGWEDNTLIIKFKNNRVYQYSAVPKEVFDEMLASSSVGSYYHHNIKGHYNSEEI